MIIDWFTVIAQVVNFLILVWLLKRFLYRPILQAIDEREQRIAAELADANASKLAAQSERDEFMRKNEAFDQARADMTAKAMEEAQNERQQFVNVARQESEQLREQWQQALRNEHQNLSAEITRRTQEEVFAIARKALTDMAGVTLEARMVELFVQRLHGLEGAERMHLVASFKAAPAQVLVRTTYALTPQQRSAIEDAVKFVFGVEQPMQFELAPDIVSGIELVTSGQKLAWSIADYLGTLEKGVGELLSAQPVAGPDVVSGQAA
ncbi:MAG: F0F1 ATP synthase subunit B [Sulfuriferula sp.]|nr:F0F1 ATP synthase subunit B [Sulfuriferula sp.]